MTEHRGNASSKASTISWYTTQSTRHPHGNESPMGKAAVSRETVMGHPTHYPMLITGTVTSNNMEDFLHPEHLVEVRTKKRQF